MPFGIAGSKLSLPESSSVLYILSLLMLYFVVFDTRDVLPKFHFPQAVLYNAFIAANDILGCCLRCLVPRAPKSKAWRNTHRVCREVSTVLYF